MQFVEIGVQLFVPAAAGKANSAVARQPTQAMPSEITRRISLCMGVSHWRQLCFAYRSLWGMDGVVDDGTHAKANVLPSPSNTQPPARYRLNVARLVVKRWEGPPPNPSL